MKNNEQMSPEERLLKAIFGKEWKPKSKAVDEEDEAEDNYPDTNAEKIGYAQYSLIKSLEYISPALQRLTRLDSLYKCDKLPEIIAHNEARMALDKIVRVKQAVDDAYTEVLTVFKRTAEKGKEE